MPKLSSKVNVIRGWPQDGALDRVETIKSGVTLNAGDVVEKQADGTVALSSATKSRKVGLVVQGNGDSSSSVNTHKAVVLWGNYIAQIDSTAVAGTLAVNATLTGQNGKFTVGVAGTDPEVGFIAEVNSTASATNTPHIVAVIY